MRFVIIFFLSFLLLFSQVFALCGCPGEPQCCDYCSYDCKWHYSTCKGQNICCLACGEETGLGDCTGGFCGSCELRTSCQDCLENTGEKDIACGWCLNQKSCKLGTVLGSSDGICSGNNWIWQDNSRCPTTTTTTILTPKTTTQTPTTTSIYLTATPFSQTPTSTFMTTRTTILGYGSCIYPMIDSYIDEWDSSSSFSSSTVMRIARYNDQYTPNSTPQIALLKFDLSSIPPGSLISSATLKMKIDSWAGSPGYVALYNVTKPWDENVNWQYFENQGFFSNVVSRSYVTWMGDNWNTWDIKNIVQEWVKGGDNYGLAVIPEIVTNPDPNDPNGVYRGFNFATKEHENPNKRPCLEIDYFIPTSQNICNPGECCGCHLKCNTNLICTYSDDCIDLCKNGICGSHSIKIPKEGKYFYINQDELVLCCYDEGVESKRFLITSGRDDYPSTPLSFKNLESYKGDEIYFDSCDCYIQNVWEWKKNYYISSLPYKKDSLGNKEYEKLPTGWDLLLVPGQCRYTLGGIEMVDMDIIEFTNWVGSNPEDVLGSISSSIQSSDCYKLSPFGSANVFISTLDTSPVNSLLTIGSHECQRGVFMLEGVLDHMELIESGEQITVTPTQRGELIIHLACFNPLSTTKKVSRII